MPSIDAHFRPHIEVLLNGSFSGCCLKALQVREFQTSAPAVFCEEDVYDHFKLHIPYAGHMLVWEVRFDSNFPEQAPDFLFDDDAFTSFLNINVLCERVPSLENWDTENARCLSNVVQELLNLYTFYQLKRLEKDGSPLSDECSKLVQEFELQQDQIQVMSGDFQILPHYYGSSSRPPHNTVSIMVLHLEKVMAFEEIPKENAQMALQINLRTYSSNSVTLHISPVLRNILGEQAELEVPSYSKSDELATYFRTLIEILRETFSQVTQSYERRQGYHLGLFYELSGLNQMLIRLLENDIPYFTSSSYMIEYDDYPFILIVKTPISGSGDPKVSLRTVSGHVWELNGGFTWDIKTTIAAVINGVMDLKEENFEL